MHTCVEFNVYWPTCNTLFTSGFNQCIEQSEAVNLGLKIVVEHGLKGCHLWVHNHDVGSYSSLTQSNALISHSYSQIIYTMILQSLCNLNCSCSVSISLNHAHHFCLRLKERAVVVKILNHSVQVNLEYCLVHLLFQLLCNLVETKWTGSLKQNHFVAQSGKCFATKEVVNISKELLISNLNSISLGSKLWTNTYKLGYSALGGKFAHLSI